MNLARFVSLSHTENWEKRTKWVEISNILGSYCQIKVSRVMKYSLKSFIKLSKRLKESLMARGSWHTLDAYGCHYG